MPSVLGNHAKTKIGDLLVGSLQTPLIAASNLETHKKWRLVESSKGIQESTEDRTDGAPGVQGHPLLKNSTFLWKLASFHRLSGRHLGMKNANDWPLGNMSVVTSNH